MGNNENEKANETISLLKKSARVFGARTSYVAKSRGYETLSNKVVELAAWTEVLVDHSTEDISIIDAYIEFLSTCADTMEALGEIEEWKAMNSLITHFREMREIVLTLSTLEDIMSSLED